MKKLALFLLPLAIAACVERESAPPAAPAPSAPASAGASAQPSSPPSGRGEGERESSASAGAESRTDRPDVVMPPDPHVVASEGGAVEGGAVLDESGATGMGGRTPTPEAMTEDDGTAPPSDAGAPADAMPVEVMDAGPGMIP